MANHYPFAINGQYYDLPIIEYEISEEPLDSDATGRRSTWEMYRDPQGIIINLVVTFGQPKNKSDNSDFVSLWRALRSMAVGGFADITFVTPLETLTQSMYVAPYKANMRHFTKDGVKYYGEIVAEFIARGPRP